MELEIRQKFADVQKNVKWPVYLFDYQGVCVDSNNLNKIGEQIDVPEISNSDTVVTGKFQWISVGSRMGLNTYYIALLGVDEAAKGAMNLIKMLFTEGQIGLDKQTVLRSLIFDQTGTVYSEDDLLELNLPIDKSMKVVMIDHKGASHNEVKVICENIMEESVTVEVDRNHIVLITFAEDDLKDTLNAIISEMNTELLIPASAGVGKRVESWNKVNESYTGAKSALLLGNKIGDEEKVHFYDQMMVFHLLNEVDEKSRIKYFNDYGSVFKELVQDEELIQTAIRFFEYDLNVTETSRQLYVHRNTLIYRLNKIEKQTGLDLRSFDDAMQFFMLMLIWRLGKYEFDV